MNHTIEENLDYVRSAVGRPNRPMPLSIALTWSTYLIVGLTAIDLGLRWGPWFMMAGMPIALTLDALFNRRENRKKGIFGSYEDTLELWSNIIFVIGYLIVIGLSMVGHLNWQALHSIIALLVGIHLSNAGLQMRRRQKLYFNRIIFLGLLYMSGAIVMAFQSRWVWTAIAWITAIVFLSLTSIFTSKSQTADG